MAATTQGKRGGDSGHLARLAKWKQKQSRGFKNHSENSQKVDKKATTKTSESDLPLVPAVCPPVLPVRRHLGTRLMTTTRNNKPWKACAGSSPLNKDAARHFFFPPLRENTRY